MHVCDILVSALVCQKMAHVSDHDQSQSYGQLCQTQAHLYRRRLCVQSTHLCWISSWHTLHPAGVMVARQMQCTTAALDVALQCTNLFKQNTRVGIVCCEQ